MLEVDAQQNSSPELDKLRKCYPNSRLLLACQNCFKLKPPVIVEFGSSGICSWCSKELDDFLLLETSTKIGIEYSVIRKFDVNSSQIKQCQEIYELKWKYCCKGKSCPDAHSKIEFDVWELEQNNNFFRKRELLVREFNAGRLCDYSTLKGVFHCSVCSQNFLTGREFSEHCDSYSHKKMMQSVQGTRNWKFRPLPDSEDLIRCEESSCPLGDFCLKAHSAKELKEWKKRLEIQKNKLEYANQTGLMSFVDSILHEYNQSNSAASVLKEALCGVNFSTNHNRKQRIAKGSKFEWILRIICDDHSAKLNHAAFIVNRGSKNLFSICRCKRKRCSQPVEHFNFKVNMNETYSLNLHEGEATYKVLFKPQGFGFGVYHSSLVLEFRRSPRPALKIDFVVEIVDNLGFSINNKSCSNCYQNESLSWSKTRKIIPLELMITNEFEKSLKDNSNKYKSPETALNYITEKNNDQLSVFNPNNLSHKTYIERMHTFLYREEEARSDKLDRIQSFTIVFSKNYMSSYRGIVGSLDERLFAIFELPMHLSRDTDEGLLILESCSRAHIVRKDQPEDEPVYEASIIDKFTNHIVLHCSCRCIKDWKVVSGDVIDVEIQFQLDRERFARCHLALDILKNNKLLSLVCPRIKKLKKVKEIPPFSKYINPKLSELDNEQKKVINFLKSNTEHTGAFPMFVVQGSFGTGKTHTISECIKDLVESDDGAKVLICTHSNSAASLYIEKNFQDVGKWKEKVVRILFHGRNPYTESELTRQYCLWERNKFRYPTAKDIASHRIFITTFETSLVLGTRGTGLKTGVFTHIFLDEVAQVMEAAAIIPLTLADHKTKVVIAGDHKQITEKIYSKKELIPDSSFTLLERLYKFYSANCPDRCVVFRSNYRCVRPILKLIEVMFYRKDLFYPCSTELSPPDLKPVQFYDMQGVCEKDRVTGGYFNVAEACQAVTVVTGLQFQFSTLKQQDIAVVAAYEDQVRLVRAKMRENNFSDIDVERVRNIQGREFKVVIISCVHKREGKADKDGETYGLLSDCNLLNTAFTRTKIAIIVIGHAVTLWSLGRCHLMWREFIKKSIDDGGFFPERSLESIKNEALFKNLSSLNPQAEEFVPNFSLKGNQDEAQVSAPRETNESAEEESIDDGSLDEADDTLPLQDELLDLIVKNVIGIIPDKMAIKIDSSGTEFPVEASELDRGDGDASSEAFYCDFSLDHLMEFLKNQPDNYKKCVLEFISWNTATAHVLDPASNIHSIKITSKRNLGRTFDRDEVVVHIYRKSYEQEGEVTYYGKVVGILSRYKDPSERKFICVPDWHNPALMVPIDKKITKFFIQGRRKGRSEDDYMIPIYSEVPSSKNASQRKRYVKYDIYSMSLQKTRHFVVRFVKWPQNSYYAIGYVADEINPKNFEKYYQLLHDVPSSKYANYVIKEAKTIANKTDRTSRQDFSHLFVFTIDPKGSTDLDDAMSLQRCKDHKDCWMVGVHIADVASVVPQGGEVDLEARKRCNTFYSGDILTSGPRVNFPMLPEILSSKSCSLRPDGVKRPTISMIFHSACLPTITCTESSRFRNVNIPRPVLSLVKSSLQLSYCEAEKHLRKARRSSGSVDDLTECSKDNIGMQLLIIWRTMLRLRWLRIESASFCGHVDFGKFDEFCAEASTHMLIEEAMITYNACCSHFLKESKHDFILRTQHPPLLDEEEDWRNNNNVSVRMSLFQKFVVKCIRGDEAHGFIDNQLQLPQNIPVFTHVWKRIEEALKSNDLDTALILFCSDDMHPVTSSGHTNLRRIQKKAKLQLLGEISNEFTPGSVSHFSLNLPYYSWFSSPIRRYNDLQLQRLLIELCMDKKKLAISDVIPISESNHEEINLAELSKKMERHHDDAKSYERDTQNYSFALSLSEKQHYEVANIVEIEEGRVFIQFTDLKHLPKTSCRISFANMKLLDQSQGFLEWRIKYFDVNSKSSQSGSSFYYKMTKTVLPSLSWVVLLQSIHSSLGRGDAPSDGCRGWGLVLRNFQNAIQSKKTANPCPNSTNYGPCTSESCQNNFCRDRLVGRSRLNIPHFRKIKIPISCGTPLLVQLYCTVLNGVCVPSVQLLGLGDDFHICIAHNSSPVQIFASDLRPVDRKGHYKGLIEYSQFWISLSRLEGVYNSVKDDSNSIVLHNIDIFFKLPLLQEKKLSGKFKLFDQFCRKRLIDIARDDFVCIRIKQVLSPDKDSPKSSSIWVLHAVITKVHHNDWQTEFSFEACPLVVPGSNLPMEPSLITCPHPGTVEVIQLGISHRAITNSLRTITDNDPLPNQNIIEDLCMDHPQGLLSITPIEKIIASVGISIVPGMKYKLNPGQVDEIRRALSQSLTMIQGPPGTGKSFVGAHLVFYFHQCLGLTNRGKGKILYCGPSNKSVDVVAKYLLGSNLKVLRVYGKTFEEEDYPNPLKPKIEKVATEKRPDKMIERITLHQRIRSRDSGNPFWREITSFDAQFNNEGLIDFADYIEYKKLLAKAKSYEFQKHDVIVCTCATASLLKNTMQTKENKAKVEKNFIFSHCIIDECGMCSEPETLAPIIASKSLQVVLVGDHMQLQPIIMCPRAKILGMDVSMFERLKKRAGMLTNQYRMVQSICDFPSKHFYSGELTTDNSVVEREENQQFHLCHPPGSTINSIFCHVEGKETTNYSLDRGREGSYYNDLEARVVIQILLYLHRNGVPHSDIMILSPYSAQVNRIRTIIKEERADFLNVHIGTVVTSQGSENNFVILSTVRSQPVSDIEPHANLHWRRKHIGFVTDPHQINVAITRAKSALCIVGNKFLLEKDEETWLHLVRHHEEKGSLVGCDDPSAPWNGLH